MQLQKKAHWYVSAYGQVAQSDYPFSYGMQWVVLHASAGGFGRHRNKRYTQINAYNDAMRASVYIHGRIKIPSNELLMIGLTMLQNHKSR